MENSDKEKADNDVRDWKSEWNKNGEKIYKKVSHLEIDPEIQYDIQSLLMRYGPDQHIDGADHITKYIVSLLKPLKEEIEKNKVQYD